MKYYVIAKKWDSEKEAQVEFIAGMFDDYSLANIFKRAYNNEYNAQAVVVEKK